ncbi:sensor histidine kinase [Agromyces neolithicus]
MWAARATVVVVVLLTAVAGVVGAAAEGFAAAVPDVAASDPRPPLALALAGSLVGAGWAAVGAVLAWLRPANLIGWMLLVVGTLTQLSLTEEAAAAAGWLGADAAAGDWSARPIGLVLTLVVGWAIMTMLGVLPAVYPDGRLPSRRWLWPSIMVGIGAALVQVQWFFAETDAGPSTDGAGTALDAVPMLVFLAGAVAVWLLCIVRLFRSPPPRRQQLAWLLASVVLLIVVNTLGDSLTVQVAQITTLYLLPVAIAVALLRYRLLGIDAAPRADPMRTVAEIGTKVASSEEGELLGAVLASVQRSVGAPGARVLDETGAVAASVGDLASPGFTADLAVGGVPVGTLEVTARWPGDRYGARDERMLRALAAQIAAVVRAQRLTEQVEAQRDVIVDARLHERERLRRELHDGLGPALTGIGLGLEGLADAVTAQDQARALEIARVLRDEVGGTVAEVRRILDDLQPAALDDNGFSQAIRHRVAAVAATLPVEVRIGDLPVLPLEVEQAAYRIVSEAVANAARHARAARLLVEIETADGRLTLRVRDDGTGFDETAAHAGIGLASMRERARELGGELFVESALGVGTTVTFEVPIGVTVA